MVKELNLLEGESGFLSIRKNYPSKSEAISREYYIKNHRSERNKIKNINK